MIRRKAKRTAVLNKPEEDHKVLKKKKPVDDDGIGVEKELENLLFGEAAQHILATRDKPICNEKLEDRHSEYDSDEAEHAKTNTECNVTPRQPKWIDEDDENEKIDVIAGGKLRKLRDTKDESVLCGSKYSTKLRTQFEKIYGDGNWASLDRKNNQESDDGIEEEILKRTGNYLTCSHETLPRGILNIRRVNDANNSKPSNAGIQALEFHPSSKVLLTAGLNKTMDLFQIDGQDNPKLQSIFVNKFPIYNAHFSTDGQQVIMTSRRKYFYVYDMIKGKVIRIPHIRGRCEKNLEKFQVSPDGSHLVFLGDNGYMMLVSSRTKQWIGNLKMNGTVGAVTFSADGSHMFSTGSDGEVYIWDMNTRTCLHKFTDDGCLMGTSLAASKDGQYLACGSDSGVVNVYDNKCFNQSKPKPLKSVTNITTPVDGTLFNSSSEILAISSRFGRDAFKLVHLPSLSVFSNWPNSKAPLRYVHSFDFSPNSGFLSIGNDQGKALLYRINHYTDS
ncbi:U3 small nucleolar RNA-associated protein 18 homolog isoform X2 [Actinia tenebrosa]|uniref:U3 small nucleolar RNA-associated protein 18 homolog n=1 Tax=Actinia tenebrosa TaxID=6105 RepID=A0A6P8I0J3_ACTTE|nr:U3 small nucleolar RNA-associated protein 18 homolog isoform X2 [Actinia tenebrosa]